MTAFFQKISVTRFLLMAINEQLNATGHMPIKFELASQLYFTLLAEVPCYLVFRENKVFLGSVQIRPTDDTYPVMVDHLEERHFI